MKVIIASVRPTVATASAPRRDTKNTSTTANTDSSTSSSTIGIASRRIARPIGPSVYSPRCDPAIDSRIVVHRLASVRGAETSVSLIGSTFASSESSPMDYVQSEPFSLRGDAIGRPDRSSHGWSGFVGDRVDLYAHPIARQPGDLDRGSRRTMIAEHARVDAVHLLELAHVDQEHAAAQHVLQARAGRFQDRLHVPETLLGLLLHIVRYFSG